MSGSEQVECYINNGTGSVTLDSSTEVKVKEEHCPCGFRGLVVSGGCYRFETTRLKWNDAEAACQALDLRAHLASLETQGVKQILVM